MDITFHSKSKTASVTAMQDEDTHHTVLDQKEPATGVCLAALRVWGIDPETL